MKNSRPLAILMLPVFFFVAAGPSSSGAAGLIYQCDDANRLVSVEYPSSCRIEYSYDSVGNRSQRLVSAIADPNDLTGDGDVDEIDLMFFAEDFSRVEDIPQ
ncbi:MAG: hypothetical protein J7L35_04190 [Anaerolineales bacterium]|nr:hypothetical protein [Anaerolineales bacterium]